MIKLVPECDLISANCPRCGAENNEKGKLYFQGIHCLAVHTCSDCGLAFYKTLPIGHAALFPVAFSQDGTFAHFNREEGSWMALPLIRSFRKESGLHTEIELVQPGSGGDLILVNCLDSCFGHVFTKLWNVYLLKKRFPFKTIAVLIPARFRWLISDPRVEIWSVDLPLKKVDQGVKGLDAWVKLQFKRFDSVALSEVPVHLAQEQLDLGEILQARPFDLADFDKLPVQLTFIWRNDRFWLNSSLLDLLHKASIKFGFQKVVRRLMCFRQVRLLRKFRKRMRVVLPEARFTVTGFGKTGRLPKGWKDLRVGQIEEPMERRWNEIFRKSQVVLGVHGSHMLIPTALAAGFVEILPRHKIPHLTEDIGRHQAGRWGHFLGRFVDEFSSPGLVAEHVQGMVKGFGRACKGQSREVWKREKIMRVENR